MVTIDFKLANIKLEYSMAYLLKLGKICCRISKLFTFFRKNEVLNICPYLKRFYTKKKINVIFLNFHHSLVRMPKIIEIG